MVSASSFLFETASRRRPPSLHGLVGRFFLAESVCVCIFCHLFCSIFTVSFMCGEIARWRSHTMQRRPKRCDIIVAQFSSEIARVCVCVCAFCWLMSVLFCC